MSDILHVIDTGGPGGAETVFMNLAAGLDGQGRRSIPVVSREGWLAEQLRARALHPVILSGKGGFNLPYLAGLVSLIRRHEPGAVVAHLFGAAVYCGLAGLLTRTPVIAVLHGQTDVSMSDRLATYKAALLRAGCARVVFVSTALQDELAPRLRLAPGQAQVITNGVDMKRFSPRRSVALRTELGLSPGTLLVGAIGNIRRPKGYDDLLRAARITLDHGVDTHFVVAGEPKEPLFSELLALRTELELDQKFTFLGLRTDAPSILHGLDIFVSSSTSEGFSLACVEAMAAELPVVATRSGGPETIIEDGRTGLLAPVSDPRSLAEAIARLSHDISLRKRLGTAARLQAEARYSLQSTLERYDSLIRQVADASHAK